MLEAMVVELAKDRARLLATLTELQLRSPPAIVLMEATRDGGGALTCRECGRAVDRSEPEIHFIDDGTCDCQHCYERADTDAEEDDHAN